MKFNRLKTMAAGVIFALLAFVHLSAQTKGTDADKNAISKGDRQL
jgi:hypothetical protein